MGRDRMNVDAIRAVIEKAPDLIQSRFVCERGKHCVIGELLYAAGVPNERIRAAVDEANNAALSSTWYIYSVFKTVLREHYDIRSAWQMSLLIQENDSWFVGNAGVQQHMLRKLPYIASLVSDEDGRRRPRPSTGDSTT